MADLGYQSRFSRDPDGSLPERASNPRLGMISPSGRRDSTDRNPGPHGDGGVSFIEILVAVVLLGTAVVATLTALRTTIIGSAIERDHARAHEWLQSASEILINDIDYLDCDDGASTLTALQIQTGYETALRSRADIIPSSWGANQIEIARPAEFAQPDATYSSAVCIEPIDRQLIEVQVEDTEGKIVESVEVVVVP